MKTTKGGKVMNPTDAYRKELRKKELKRNKKERKKVREVGILKKDPEVLREQIEKLEMMKADGALDKARKHKKRQLEDTLNLVLKKRKEYEDKMKEKGETPVMFSHLGPPPRRRTSAEEEERAKHPKPEDSVYYHATLNPTGAPPPGKPPMYKSSIGPRIPLSTASSSAAASSSNTDAEDAALEVPPPPPPPPPPLPEGSSLGPGDVSVPISLPLPPLPPMPPKPAAPTLGISLPPAPMPPPPPGPPPKDQISSHTPLPYSAQPPPPGTSESEGEKILSASTGEPPSKETVQAPAVFPPLPPPPGLPPKSASNLSESASSEADANILASNDNAKMVPPPPPPRQLPSGTGPTLMQTLQPDVLPPGISHIPPLPPPPNVHPPIPGTGLPGQLASPGVMVPLIPRPPYGPPPGPPLMVRPPLPPGPPPNFQEEAANMPPVPLKPSYVKSAASTVVKRPLAQHTPELTAMVPASVRVRRETAVPKPKPKPTVSTTTVVTRAATPAVVRPEPVSSSSAPRIQSIDDSYSAFLEDMKALGALDG